MEIFIKVWTDNRSADNSPPTHHHPTNFPYTETNFSHAQASQPLQTEWTAQEGEDQRSPHRVHRGKWWRHRRSDQWELATSPSGAPELSGAPQSRPDPSGHHRFDRQVHFDLAVHEIARKGISLSFLLNQEGSRQRVQQEGESEEERLEVQLGGFRSSGNFFQGAEFELDKIEGRPRLQHYHGPEIFGKREKGVAEQVGSGTEEVFHRDHRRHDIVSKSFYHREPPQRECEKILNYCFYL